MRFDFKVTGDPVAQMEAEIAAAERGVTRGVRLAGAGLKKDWRGQVMGAGLGQRLANTVRARNFPDQVESIGAASLVYSRAPVVMDAQDRGALIRSEAGLWLAIPIGEVQKIRGPKNTRITPSGWEQKTGRKLTFIYRKGKPSLLVDTGVSADRTLADPVSWKSSRRRRNTNKVVPIFILVPQAKLRRKMNLDRASERWGNRLPGLILDNWREVGRA